MRLRSIGEAARVAGVSQSTLRLWEQEGLISPGRTKGGARRWSEADIERASRVAYLRRVEKLNYAAIRQLMLRPSAPRRETTNHDLGRRLRALRKARGVTLQGVAELSGLSVPFISLIERGLTGASVATWEKLLASLNATLPELLEDEKTESRRLVRASERRVFHTGAGVRIEHLSNGRTSMEPQLFHLEPGAGSEGTYEHNGEEFLLVLNGRLEFRLGADERYELGPGDSLYCPSDKPHSWRNPGKRPASIVWVNTPPTF